MRCLRGAGATITRKTTKDGPNAEWLENRQMRMI
jgi:hypothetical protein